MGQAKLRGTKEERTREANERDFKRIQALFRLSTRTRQQAGLLERLVNKNRAFLEMLAKQEEKEKNDESK